MPTKKQMRDLEIFDFLWGNPSYQGREHDSSPLTEKNYESEINSNNDYSGEILGKITYDPISKELNIIPLEEDNTKGLEEKL